MQHALVPHFPFSSSDCYRQAKYLGLRTVCLKVLFCFHCQFNAMRPRLSSVPLILVFRCHPQVKYTPGCGGRRRRRTGWRCRMRATTWTAGGGRRTRRARTAAPVATSTVGFPHDVLSRRRPRPPPAPGGRARRCPPRRGSVLGQRVRRRASAGRTGCARRPGPRAAGGGRAEQGRRRRCPRAPPASPTTPCPVGGRVLLQRPGACASLSSREGECVPGQRVRRRTGAGRTGCARPPGQWAAGGRRRTHRARTAAPVPTSSPASPNTSSPVGGRLLLQRPPGVRVAVLLGAPGGGRAPRGYPVRKEVPGVAALPRPGPPLWRY